MTDEQETEPRLLRITSTSSRIQVVPGNTNNRIYAFPQSMPVLVQLGTAARTYYKDEKGVLPSQMQVCGLSYDEVEPFLVRFEKNLCYWLDGNNPIWVTVYDKLWPHQVKCIGRTTGAMAKLVDVEQREQQSA